MELGNGIGLKVDHDYVWALQEKSRGESNLPIPVPVLNAGFDPQGILLGPGKFLPNNIKL